MDIDIYFDPVAHKHNYTVEDIKMAFDNAEYDGFVDEDDPDADNKNLLIGFDTKANLIEVFYNVIADGSIKVFHAMKCRRKFIDLLDRRKR
jgi:uncharacterized DUF497 family protein